MVRAPGTSVISLSAMAHAAENAGLLSAAAARPAEWPARRCTPSAASAPSTGIDLDEFNKMSGGFKYIAGGPFQQHDDIIVDQFYANQNKLASVRTVKLLNHDWRVCGIVEPGKLARIVIPGRTLQDLAAATRKAEPDLPQARRSGQHRRA